MPLLRPAVMYLASALLLSACTASISPPTIDPNQVYLGYPCADECPAFKQGYEAARSQNLKNDAACGSAVSASTTGCKAAVLDSNMREDPTGGFVFID